MGKLVLVTGGAGYIGAQACKALARRGYEPVAFDNLSRGHRDAVRWGPLVEGDLADRDTIDATLAQYRPVAVMHFAAHAQVAQSMREPVLYFRDNVGTSINLFDAASRAGAPPIVLSSSCSVYGQPPDMPIAETAPLNPVNPYGESKLMTERMLEWLGRLKGLRYVSLRYFNAAGADPEGEIGERHEPESHLIPLALRAASGGEPITVLGTDYPTPDGTAIRDYVHVHDLAEAHVQALDYLLAGNPSVALNLGTGTGHSVREVIDTVERVTGRPVPHRAAPRRPGDPPVLVADPTRARGVLHWTPALPRLADMVETAWRWHCKS